MHQEADENEEIRAEQASNNQKGKDENEYLKKLEKRDIMIKHDGKKYFGKRGDGCGR